MSDPISTIGIAQLHQQVTTLEAVVETNTKAIDNLADLLATAIKQNTLMASVTELSARMEHRAEKAEGITVKMDGGRAWHIKCPVCGKWEVWPEKACRGSVELACECGNIQEMHFSEPCTITINEEKADEDATEQD